MAAPGVAAAAATAGGSILGSLISGAFNIGATNATNRTNMRIQAGINDLNRELAHYQWEQNLAQWNRENFYNSPAEQMKRFQRAGLNPNLIYGQQNLAASSPSYQAPTMEGVRMNAPQINLGDLGMMNAVSVYQDYALKDAQINNLQAQEENTRARAENEILRGLLWGQKYTYNKEFYPLSIRGLSSDVSYKEQSLPFRVDLSRHQADLASERVRLTNRQTQLAIAKMRLANAQKLAVDADTRLKAANLNWFNQRNRFGYENMMNYQYNKAFGIGIGSISDQIGKGIERNVVNPVKNTWNNFKNKISNIHFKPQYIRGNFGYYKNY